VNIPAAGQRCFAKEALIAINPCGSPAELTQALAVRQEIVGNFPTKKLLTFLLGFPYRPPQMHRLGAGRVNRIYLFSIKRTKTVAGGNIE